ncbi:adhesion G protein-coupled receptor E3-like [Notamacropus eugenii]|uniref:adhesion G protein-coupled receptor E3-like n=1 Tax=Notamacropus eugenii TaxID=9315 RepID=UPI003B68411F
MSPKDQFRHYSNRIQLLLLTLNWFCVLVLLETAVAQNPKDSQCRHRCPQNATCINGTHCTCDDGFASSSGEKYFSDSLELCDDVNECVPPISASCGLNADCANMEGSYYCTCAPGYAHPSGEKTFPNATMNDCQDMDECQQNPSFCGSHGLCINMLGSYICKCNPGFGNRNKNQIMDCIDVNECAPPINISCGQNAGCVNTEGSYHCTCVPGYALPSGEETFPNATMNDCQGKTDWCFNLIKDIFSRNCDLQPTAAYSPNVYREFCLGLKKLSSECGNDNASFITVIANNLDILLDQVKGSPAETAQIMTFYLENVWNVIFEFVLNFPLGSGISEKKESVVIQTLIFEGGCNKSNAFHMDAGNERMDFDCIPTTEKDSKGVAVLISYASIGSIIDKRFVSTENLTTNEESISFHLNSKIVRGIIGYRSGSSLSIPVNFTFQHIRMRNGKEKPLCVYWNKTFWSNQGCKTTWYNDSQTVCSCTHLSSFAVLMASVELEEDSVLTVITYVGLTLSLLCLLLAALTFLLCGSIKGTNTFFHLQLSLCLFLTKLLFLIGIKQTQLKIVCSIIAGGLHYLYLAAFTWLFLEGLHLFLTARNLKVANYNSAGQFKRRFMYLFGYGIPAVIVTMSAGSSSQHYGTDRYCWMKVEKGFIWSFLGPVYMISLMNLSFCLTTLWILRERLSSLNKEVSTIQNTRTLTIKALAQLFILGCSWSLGFFLIDSVAKPAQSVIAYTFTIINSLQGVYIFLIHCVLSHQVQEEYKKCFKRIKVMTETDTYVLSISTSHSRMLEK